MNSNAPSASPGERWLVNLQPIDAATEDPHEVTVKLLDFDPRTDTWSVEQEGVSGSTALLAKHLIRRLE